MVMNDAIFCQGPEGASQLLAQVSQVFITCGTAQHNLFLSADVLNYIYSKQHSVLASSRETYMALRVFLFSSTLPFQRGILHQAGSYQLWKASLKQQKALPEDIIFWTVVVERLICNVEMWGLPSYLLHEAFECQQSAERRLLTFPIPNEHNPGLKPEQKPPCIKVQRKDCHCWQ